jgi:hypothetical protein
LAASGTGLIDDRRRYWLLVAAGGRAWSASRCQPPPLAVAA